MSTAGRAHIMSYFTKKRGRQQQGHLLQRDKSSQPTIFKLLKPLQLTPTLHSPETMSSGTVHAADFCIIAQRLLAATKIHGK